MQGVFAWSSADVFYASIVASIIEMGNLVDVVLDGRCDVLNQVLEKYFDKVRGPTPGVN